MGEAASRSRRASHLSVQPPLLLHPRTMAPTLIGLPVAMIKLCLLGAFCITVVASASPRRQGLRRPSQMVSLSPSAFLAPVTRHAVGSSMPTRWSRATKVSFTFMSDQQGIISRWEDNETRTSWFSLWSEGMPVSLSSLLVKPLYDTLPQCLKPFSLFYRMVLYRSQVLQLLVQCVARYRHYRLLLPSGRA